VFPVLIALNGHGEQVAFDNSDPRSPRELGPIEAAAVRAGIKRGEAWQVDVFSPWDEAVLSAAAELFPGVAFEVLGDDDLERCAQRAACVMAERSACRGGHD
jgi:hypothetical protein